MAYFCTLVVGAVFLFTGALKAFSSLPFIKHMFNYRLIHSRFVPKAAVAFIGLEVALGAALALHVFPQWLVPGAIILLVCLSGLTIWGTISGRVEECGCYGGLMLLTPKQSVLLNIGYALLLAAAWLMPVAGYTTELWKVLVVLLALAAALTLGWRSQFKPVIDLSPLKVGKQWKPRWLKNSSQNLQQGSHFIVFLSKDCPYCKQWVPLLNIMGVQEDLPNVLGIMSLTSAEVEDFKSNHLVRFPIVHMEKVLVGVMVDGVPTAALIENGVISSKWFGEMPKAYVDRIRQFYESISPKSAEQPRAFGG